MNQIYDTRSDWNSLDFVRAMMLNSTVAPIRFKHQWLDSITLIGSIKPVIKKLPT